MSARKWFNVFNGLKKQKQFKFIFIKTKRPTFHEKEVIARGDTEGNGRSTKRS